MNNLKVKKNNGEKSKRKKMKKIAAKV